MRGQPTTVTSQVGGPTYKLEGAGAIEKIVTQPGIRVRSNPNSQIKGDRTQTPFLSMPTVSYTENKCIETLKNSCLILSQIATDQHSGRSMSYSCFSGRRFVSRLYEQLQGTEDRVQARYYSQTWFNRTFMIELQPNYEVCLGSHY